MQAHTCCKCVANVLLMCQVKGLQKALEFWSEIPSRPEAPGLQTLAPKAPSNASSSSETSKTARQLASSLRISPHLVGLFCPYSRFLLTLVWSAQALESDCVIDQISRHTSMAEFYRQGDRVVALVGFNKISMCC